MTGCFVFSPKPFDFHAIHIKYIYYPLWLWFWILKNTATYKLHWNIRPTSYFTYLIVLYNQLAKYIETKEIIQILNNLYCAALFLQNEIKVWEKEEQPLWEQLSSLQKVEFILIWKGEAIFHKIIFLQHHWQQLLVSWLAHIIFVCEWKLHTLEQMLLISNREAIIQVFLLKFFGT